MQPYPTGPAQRVSPSGGIDPVWSRSGAELFYREQNTMMAVPVEHESSALAIGSPRSLFEIDGWQTDVRGHNYDVAPDGRFVLVEMDAAASGSRGRMTVILNWTQELQRRVPVP